MGLLTINKKLKANTLVETLVGMAIILIIFVMATMSLNRVFGYVMKNNTRGIDNYIYKLRYLHEHHRIIPPYQEDYGDWEVEMQEEYIGDRRHIQIKMRNKKTKKKKIIEYDHEIIGR